MNHLAAFDVAFAQCPLIAILRGVKPDEVEAIGDALADAGFTLIEVPLNSPDPFDSITRLARRLGDRAMVGGGTVLREAEVIAVAESAGRLIVSPNASPAVIAATAAHGLISLPGIATPTEAFAALDAGATALKLFPAEAASPVALKAMRAVLPVATRVLPVGGITPDTMQPWRDTGASGFGLGSALYRPGFSAAEVGARAAAFVRALA